MDNRLLFLISAIFNWVIAIGLFVLPAFMQELLLTTPPVSSFAFLYMTGLLVGVFGYGYYLAYRDFAQARLIIHLGAVGKLGVFALVATLFATGEATLIFLAVAACDLGFAYLFWRALGRRAATV